MRKGLVAIVETSLFKKQVKASLSDEEYRALQLELAREPTAGGIQMNDKMFNELLQSVREGGAILRGKTAPSRSFTIENPDVGAIRRNFKLSQPKFAAFLGISTRTLQNWEQKRRKPEGPARVLLQVAAKHPEAVLDVVSETRASRRAVSGKPVAQTSTSRTRKARAASAATGRKKPVAKSRAKK